MKRIIFILGILLIVGYGFRVYAVNKTARQRMPQENVVEQGEEILLNDIRYTIDKVQSFDTKEYAEDYPEYEEYCNMPDSELLLVTVRIEFDEEKTEVLPAFDMWMKYGENITYYDVFFFEELNPQLLEGTYKSGETIVVPYAILNCNLTEEHLEMVRNNEISNLGVELKVGTYPEKFRLLITQIEDCP